MTRPRLRLIEAVLVAAATLCFLTGYLDGSVLDRSPLYAGLFLLALAWVVELVFLAD